MTNMFNIFALGQCGCRISKEFEDKGFKVFYINTDSVDMRNFNTTSNRVLMLGTTGSGRSPAKGRFILERNFGKFTNFMDIHLNSNVLNIFVLGLGGGTGGGMILPSLEYAKSKKCRVGVIATLPPKLAGILDTDNAIKGLKELKDIDKSLYILADNEFLIKKVGISAEWWRRINYYIFARIYSAFDLLRDNKISHTGIGSIDRGELSRIFQYGKGLLDVRDIYFQLPAALNLSDDELQQKLFEPLLISGYNYKDTLFYLLNIDVPVRGGYTEFASRIFTISKKVFGSSMARIGMFSDPALSKSIRVTIMSAGLKLPKILKSKIKNLKRDFERHTIKKNKEDSIDLDEIETTIDDDFDL